MSAADTAIQYALQQVGKPYKWGATGPDSFDCSGLVYAAYGAAGIRLARTTYGQVLQGTRVASSKELAAGDLVFPDPGHVQIYLGSGKVVEAPHTGAQVRVMNMWGFWTARRITAPGQSFTDVNVVTAGVADKYPCYSQMAGPHGMIWYWNNKCPESQRSTSPRPPNAVDPGPHDLDQLGQILSAFQNIGARLAWLTDSHNWLRMGEFVAGFALLIIGLIGLDKAKNAVKSAGKVAANATA